MTDADARKTTFWRWRATDALIGLTGGVVSGVLDVVHGGTPGEGVLSGVIVAVAVFLTLPLVRHLVHGDKDPKA